MNWRSHTRLKLSISFDSLAEILLDKRSSVLSPKNIILSSTRRHKLYYKLEIDKGYTTLPFSELLIAFKKTSVLFPKHEPDLWGVGFRRCFIGIKNWCEMVIITTKLYSQIIKQSDNVVDIFKLFSYSWMSLDSKVPRTPLHMGKWYGGGGGQNYCDS